ncbi:MAG: cysteine hydrolase [Candidatus Marinimicrobia bacterium]|nr:cysteine hydrolase [Candidatus Neomarinimicrobiota bacterium]
MKPVLLVIDVQKEFFEYSQKTKQSLNEAMDYINAAISLFREKELPIICVQHLDEEDGLFPGEDGFELPKELDIVTSDRHIHKTYGNAFNKTSLNETIRSLEVDTVIITGFSAEGCVLSTFKGAEDLDLMPIILRSSLASGNPENIAFIENICNIISIGALRKMLN